MQAERTSGYRSGDWIYSRPSTAHRHFAHPPIDDDSLRGTLWRAYSRVKVGIRFPFTRATLRTSTGYAHHAIDAIQWGKLDWGDPWRPALSGEPRSWWGGETIQPVVDVSDDFGPTTGPLEAWVQFEP